MRFLVIILFLWVSISSKFSMGQVDGLLDVPHNNIEGFAEFLRSDVRVVAMGDSYSTPLWGRVPQASLLAWPIPRITAICSGAPLNSHLIRNVRLCSPVDSILAGDKLGYTVLRSSPNPSAFSLPLRCMSEIYTSDLFAPGHNGNLFQSKIDDDSLSGGVSGSFLGFNDHLNYRLLYWVPEEPEKLSLSKVKVRDVNSFVGEADLLHGARGFRHLGESAEDGTRTAIPLNINASGQDYIVNNARYNNLKVTLFQNEPLTGTHRYFHLAGNLFYYSDANQVPIEGFYYSYLADDGWGLNGFGCDSIPEDGFDKKFTKDQFLHWLDVTTISLDQPVLFYWYFGVEWLHFDDVITALEAMILQTDEVANELGITDWKHLLVMPHMYRFGSLGNSPQAHTWMQETRDAMLLISEWYPHVGFISIYDRTAGELFDGSESGKSWLENHGFDEFHCGNQVYDLVNGPLQGDLLDAADLHPWSIASGSFFASIVGDVIRQVNCRSDLVLNGVIDVDDLLDLISKMTLQDLQGDLNDDGVTDVNDLLVLIGEWGDCWPVQAPFSN